MLKCLLLLLALAIQLILCPVHVLAGHESEGPRNPVIGIILPFSSAFEDIALEQQKAINLALAESGHPFDLVFKDGGADRQSAVDAFNELAGLENRPAAIISCSSWASDAIHPLAAEKGLFHIAIGSAALNRTVPGSTVRFTLDAGAEQKQINQYLRSFERIAVLAMDNDLGKTWLEMLRQSFPGKIVSGSLYNPQKMDISINLIEIKDKKPDALVLISAGEASEIARQARNAGIQAQLVGTRPIQRSALLTRPQYTNGLVYTYPSYNTKHHFISDFREAYQYNPGFFGVEAYDAITTLFRAFEQGHTTFEALFEWYAGQTYIGALGRIEFNSNGDASYPYLYKQIVDGEFQVARFQFSMLLETVRQQLDNIFQDMDRSIAQAAGKLSASGLHGDLAGTVLKELFDENPYAFNCVTVDKNGIIVNVAPDKYREVIGEDISGQEQIIRLHSTHEPVLSQAVLMVEGFVGIDLEHPVFGPDNQFIGSVSILARPDFFGSIISRKIYNFPVEIFVFQTDGTTIYDINEEEIGKNAFHDQIYQSFPSLVKIARRMVTEPEGQGQYRFKNRHMEKVIEKDIIWTSIGLHGTEYRLALIYSEQEL